MTELEEYLQSNHYHGDLESWPLTDSSHFINQWNIREAVRKKYGFAILTQRMIDRIKPYGPIIEVGAGLGVRV